MVVRFRTPSGDNYSYLIADPGAGSAMLVDPVAVDPIREYLRDHSLDPAVVVNTHSHGDHTSGNDAFLGDGSVELRCHPDAVASVGSEARPLEDGETLSVGSREVEVLHTPGHTTDSLCLVTPEALLTGDTAFLAGCGNTKFGGNTRRLFESIRDRIRPLPDDLTLCPGHDYALRNLRFAAQRDPDNPHVREKIEDVEQTLDEGGEPTSSLGEEQQYNPFFRFDEPALIQQLPDVGSSPSDWDVFRNLREQRNQW